jgi:P pilus assembly chaperone PapD
MTYATRLLAAVLMLTPAAALAQGVIVAPHAVYIDHATRSGSITLYNPGDDPVEVSVSFGFGIPTNDSSGAIGLELQDSAPPGQPGATAWLQAFPRRVTVGKQERQTIRILATPPAGLPDGEYWARLIVGAKAGQVPVAGAPDSTGISVGLTLEVRTVLAVAYRKGALTTGVSLAPVSAQYANDTVTVRVPLTRIGTAAYLGTARASLIGPKDAMLGQDERPIAVYYTLDPRLDIPVGTLPPGTYKVRVSVATDRTDLPPRVPLPAPPVRDSVEFTVR